MEIINLLCEGLNALEDKMQEKIREIENYHWGKGDTEEEKEEADRELGFLRGRREAFIQIHKSLKQIDFRQGG